MPPPGRHWSTTKERFEQLLAENRIYFGRDGNGMAQRKKLWAEEEHSLVPGTWWPYEETGENREANREAKEISDLASIPVRFATPKPERLLQRIIYAATNSGDLVLDSFAGSGTAGAVAHKMGRRWIMVELAAHAVTHVVPRLKHVIDGTDQGGISQTVDWKGGGGFRFFQLAPSLLEKDRWGNWVVSKQYNAAMLSEAMCKHEGFTYAPSDTLYWQHGYSTERDFIYVTTQTLTHDQLLALNEEVGENRSLLVCCGAFRGNQDHFPNLTLKKIPNAVLNRCEWGRDDYSLKIASLPPAPTSEPETSHQPANGHVRRSTPAAGQLMLEQAEQV